MDGMSRWYWNLRHYCKPAIRYAVITAIPTQDGNEYDEFLVLQPTVTGWPGVVEQIYHVMGDFQREFLQVRLPVFEVGEILLVNRLGREIAGRGRKPDKWGVECEYFWTRRAAVKRAREVSK